MIYASPEEASCRSVGRSGDRVTPTHPTKGRNVYDFGENIAATLTGPVPVHARLTEGDQFFFFLGGSQTAVETWNDLRTSDRTDV